MKKGRKLSAEHKAKISAANLGRKRSFETKIKMSLKRREITKQRRSFPRLMW